MKQKLRLLMMTLLCAVVSTAWGQNPETIILSDQGYTNGQVVSSTKGTNFTITYNKGTSSTTPAYYDTGEGVRVYAGGNVVISSKKTMTKVVFTYNKDKSPTVKIGTTTVNSPATWEGEANSVQLDVTTKGHIRLQSVEVTFKGGGQATPITITEARTQATGSVYTKGIVTSCVGKTAYIQDETAGICVYGNDNLNLTIGDEITVQGTLTTYNGLLEIISPTCTVVSSGNTVTPEVKTIEEISNDIQGILVKIENANVTAIDGQNTIIEQEGNTITVRGISGVEYAVGDIISLTGNVGCYNTVQIVNPRDITVIKDQTPSITVNPTSINVPAAETEGTIGVTFTNVDPDADIVFYEADGTTVTSCDWIIAEINGNNIEYLVDENEGEARTAYFKVYGLDNNANDVYSELITITQAAAPEPSISVASTNVELTAAAGDGSIEVTYTRTEPYDVAFYEEDGETAAEYDWIEADFDDSNNIYYIVEENTSNEARTAYLKIVALGPDGDDLIYSDLITITQAAPIVDYATLPFEFDGGKADIEGTSGLTQEGLDSDYGSSPKLKFNGTGDYVILKFNERPGKLTFDLKGNSFSDGTFTVQTSEDGDTYTDLKAYNNDNFGNTLYNEEFDNLGENVRYIKWIYTNKASGNVALGNIKLEKYVAPQPYTLTITEADNAEIFAFYNDPDNNYPDIQSGDEVLSGSEVMISISASEGYEIENVSVTDGEGQAVQLTEKEEGISWTFIMPRSVVTVACTAIKERKKYVKVTSTDDITSGKYLIVYEEGSVAFDGSLETLDAASNIQDVVIKNNVIKTDEPIYFTIDVNKGSIRSKSGKYIGQTSDSNGLKASDEEAYTNTISIGDDGNAVILSSGGAYLRFNKTTNAARFRYYKSESYDQQQPIQLYKAEDEPFTFTISDRATDGETCYATIADLGAGYFKVEGNVEVSTVVINEDKQLSYPITFKENDVISGQGAYLVKGAAGEYTFPTAEEGTVTDLGENMLISSGMGDVSADDMLAIAKAATNHEGDFKFYKLSLNGKGEAGSVGFYWGAAKGAAFNYTKAHQAFLAVPQTGESIESGDDVAAYLFDGDKTGIYNVMATESESSDDTYTLSGIRVENKQLPKGIYIKNGKKVVVR